MGILVKNINIGAEDISNIGDGSVKGAIKQIYELNEDKIKFGIVNGKYGYYDANNNFVNFKTPTGDATTAHVLSGKTFSNATSIGLTGGMANRGAVASTINAGDTYTILEGYHNGNGIVRAETLANQTTIDSGKTAAAAAQILTGYQAWVNGNKISGTMPNYTALNTTVNVNSTMVMPAGRYAASTIVGQTLNGDATAGYVYKGKTFYNNTSQKQTGTMTTYASLKTTANAMSTVAIPAGYYPASTVVGQTLSGNAVGSQVYNGRTFYNNTSQKVTGSMPVNTNGLTASSVGTNSNGPFVTFPYGYYPQYLDKGYGYVQLTTAQAFGVATRSGAIATNGTLTGSHSSTVAGAASTYTVKPSIAGYYTTTDVNNLVASQSAAIAPAGGTGTVSVNIKPGYYNKIVVNRTNAYNAGTKAGAQAAQTINVTTYTCTLTSTDGAKNFSGTVNVGSGLILWKNLFVRWNGFTANPDGKPHSFNLTYNYSGSVLTCNLVRTSSSGSQNSSTISCTVYKITVG